MGKIILLTHADMRWQTGDVTLIRRRAQAMYCRLHIPTTCILLYEQDHLPFASEGINFAFAKNDNTIIEAIASLENLDLVILYGRKALAKINFIKRKLQSINSMARIFIDIQGVYEESIEYSRGFRKTINFLKYMVKQLILKAALNKADGAFVVSDELSEYCRKLLKKSRMSQFRTYKVRCGVINILGREQKISWRYQVRRDLGIEDNVTVFVFSGYRMAWQKIDETIEKFREYDKYKENSFFAFFCNLDSEFEKKIEDCFPKGNYLLKHLNAEEYFRYLCACDVGFLLRDHNTTNRVAFPNKFSDYLNSGLIVATSKAIPEPYRILQKSGIEYVDLESDDIESIFAKVHKRKKYLTEFYKKTEELCSKELLYSSQIEKLDIGY